MKKLFTLIVLAGMLFSTGTAQTCYSLFNLVSSKDVPYLYYADTGKNTGYLSGNNEFGDAAVAEGFQAIVGDSVFYAVFYFGIVTINPADSDNSLLVGVWDNTGISAYGKPGAPGNRIDSTSVTLRQIAQSLTATIQNDSFIPLQVNFTQRNAITTDTIYIGIFLPTTNGDTIVLFTNEVPPGTDGNGWDYQDGTWGSYSDDFSFKSPIGNYIGAEICGDVSTGVNTLNDNFTIKIFPNPANNQLNFEWSVNDEADVTMYDITGKSLKSFIIHGTAVNTFNIQDLAQGTYIIHVTDRQTNQQSSSLFVKM